MRYLPMSFDTKDKTVLVIGGESEALDRIKRLLESEFQIYVIANNFIEELIKLAHDNSERISIKKGEIDENFVFFGYDYLIIATHNYNLNSSLEIRAQKSKIPYERCDLVSNSNLLMNKSIEKEGLCIGITTNGLNPTITNIVYEDIEKLLNRYSSEKFSILNSIRKELIKRNDQNIDTKLRNLFNQDINSLNEHLSNLENSEIRTEEVSKLKLELDRQIQEVMAELEKRVSEDKNKISTKDITTISEEENNNKKEDVY